MRNHSPPHVHAGSWGGHVCWAGSRPCAIFSAASEDEDLHNYCVFSLWPLGGDTILEIQETFKFQIFQFRKMILVSFYIRIAFKICARERVEIIGVFDKRTVIYWPFMLLKMPSDRILTLLLRLRPAGLTHPRLDRGRLLLV